MNKFLTHEGGQPIWLEDIDFMNESVRDVLKLLLQGITGEESPKCILVKPTPEKDGVICVDGEIMPYEYRRYDMVGALVVTVETKLAGNRLFKNGSYQACHEIRYAYNTNEINYDSPNALTKFSYLPELLVARGQYFSGKINDSSGGVIARQVTITQLGSNRYEVAMNFKSISALGVETSALAKDLQVHVPGIMAGTYYSSITAEINGELQLIPAKIVLIENGDADCKATVTIPLTSLPYGSQATLTFTITR